MRDLASASVRLTRARRHLTEAQELLSRAEEAFERAQQDLQEAEEEEREQREREEEDSTPVGPYQSSPERAALEAIHEVARVAVLGEDGS
eukprot:4162427-Lingulodinium_polyedra.AAC.1